MNENRFLEGPSRRQPQKILNHDAGPQQAAQDYLNRLTGAGNSDSAATGPFLASAPKQATEKARKERTLVEQTGKQQGPQRGDQNKRRR